MTSQPVGRLTFIICEKNGIYDNIIHTRCEVDTVLYRVVYMVMRRLRRSDDSLYRKYNQNEGFQRNFRNLLRQIIDDQDYREVVDNHPTDN